MDKLSKLQALLPDTPVVTTGDEWTYQPKPAHLYEGTDSDDDEEVMRQGRLAGSLMVESSWMPPATETEGSSNDHGHPSSQLTTDQLEMGQLATGGEAYCPWKAVQKYPYVYIKFADRQKILARFWDDSKLEDRTWDFYYIRRLAIEANTTPIILVPTKQVKAFFVTVNQTLKVQLTIPSENNAFNVTFENDGTPQPRYLGRSTTYMMARNLHNAVPPHWFKHKTETPTMPSISDRSLAAFKAKMELMAQAQKGKKAVNTEKKKVERITKQQSWSHSTKRVQRYLGLRQASDEKQLEIARAKVDASAQWGDYSAAVKAALPRSADFQPDIAAPYDQENDVVFISVDIEANERNSTQITEIGIATLDTRDLKGLVPGERGANWLSMIRARHFRINEYKYIRNTDFVTGCPDRFEFGDSEFINLKNAPEAVANCFKHPFSGPEELISFVEENAPKRKIILVGHAVGADITYLRTMGYDVHNLSNLLEIIDTAVMWQSLKREPNPRNLGSVLAELDITGWNLHNAGNDAAYTLQAMIGISIKQLNERQKRQEDKDQEKKARIEEAVKEATQNALEREEGWSSGGENSDGGPPIVPIAPGIKKDIVQLPKKGSQYRDGPWQQPARNSNMNSQVLRNGGSWRPAGAAGNRPTPSNDSWGQARQTPSAQSSLLSASNPAPSNDSREQTKKQTSATRQTSLTLQDFVRGTSLSTIESPEPVPPPSKPERPQW